MKVLVTGGAGFIGSHIAERLCLEGYAVRVLDNFSTGHRRNLGVLADDVELIEGDIQSYERVHTAVRGCEYVFHQAALPSVPRSIHDPLRSRPTRASQEASWALQEAHARQSSVTLAAYCAVCQRKLPGAAERSSRPAGASTRASVYPPTVTADGTCRPRAGYCSEAVHA